MTEPLETWPATITEDMILGTYNEKSQPALRTFQPTYGADLTQRASSMPLRRIAFSSRLTQAEKLLLDTFWETTCVTGTSRVTRRNPKTGTSKTMKFDGPPEYTDGGPGKWIVALKFFQF